MSFLFNEKIINSEDNYSNTNSRIKNDVSSTDKIKLKEGWSLLQYDYNKNIIETYLPSYNPYYSVSTSYSSSSIYPSQLSHMQSTSTIFNQYVKNINEYRNIRKELYNEDFSYLDKYNNDEYEIYNNDNDNYSSDLDSSDENDYYYKYEKKFDI
jgi:hypothetical protein